ncbi:facilitated trehalose transporter Tret1-like [Fopius arisanus]|uniref:Facilitated trehalose transporter Tret1-like n=1 Tax=Fopius arisanus TaxID=64838 RepID=A0A9R1T0R3_9HYME|nr:PREDICTED: facilitated trehalose transporter Tret1-like [Fopius arisanus]
MSAIPEIPGDSGKWRQFIATILMNLAVLGCGVSMGWNSPMIPHLQSDDTPVGSSPMTDDQVSWLTSAMPLGALIVLPFCSGMAEHFGRKITTCFVAAPLVVCWVLTIFATNFTYLLFARFLAGSACALGFFVVPIYVTEISEASVRGLFGSLLLFSFRIGIVVGYVLGAVLSYRMFAFCGLVIPAIFLGSFVFMPETPIYLVRKGKIAEAKRSLMWYRKENKPIVEDELRGLQSLNKESLDDSDSVGFRDLFRDPGTTRAFIICVGLVTGQELSGISPMLSYTASVFTGANISMSANHAAIVVGGVQLLGCWLSSVLMDRLGRRKLLFISCVSMAVCHGAFGIFSLVKSYDYDVSSVSWIPVMALSTYGIMYSLGMGPVPFVVMSEVFAADIMSFASSVVFAMGWACSFLGTKFFPQIISTLGFHGCFLLLAFMCLYILVFTYFLVPETKGRSVESILKELNDGKKRKKKDPFPEAAVEMITKSINRTD